MSNASKLSRLFELFPNLTILKGITAPPLTVAPVTSVNGSTGAVVIPAGVTSINGQNGSVTLTGTPVQVVETDLVTAGTSAQVIPNDDTIPQIGEGAEIMTCSIAPKFASSNLYIDVVVNGTTNTQGVHMVVALFRDLGADAIAASSSQTSNANYQNQVTFRIKVAAASTAATTFRVRVGPSSAVTMTYNGQSSTRLFGGAMVSSIKITEVLA